MVLFQLSLGTNVMDLLQKGKFDSTDYAIMQFCLSNLLFTGHTLVSGGVLSPLKFILNCILNYT